MPLQLWSLRCSWGWKKCFLCTKHKRDVLWAQTLRCAAWGGEKRWRRGKGGGNWHIKEKEFKINLISQSLSPPREVYSEHALSCCETQGEHRESEPEMRNVESEVLIEVISWLPVRIFQMFTQKRQLWIKMSELVVPFLCMCVWSWT